MGKPFSSVTLPFNDWPYNKTGSMQKQVNDHSSLEYIILQRIIKLKTYIPLDDKKNKRLQGTELNIIFDA